MQMHKRKRGIYYSIVAVFVSMLLFISCSSPVPMYEIGDTGPAGGLIFYINDNDSDVWKYLEAAPSDQGSNIAWGCGGTLIDGADGTAVGTGAQNTVDIITGCTTAGIAAKICDDLILGDYSDWYLPSRDELNLMYINLSQNGLGGFDSSTPHWSSTELDANSAFIQYLDNGSQTQSNKDYDFYLVRAVRAF
jgi:hypothetical protein